MTHTIFDQLKDIFSLIGYFFWLKWGVILFLISGIVWMHKQEHHHLQTQLRKVVQKASSEGILQSFSFRSLQIIFLLMIIFIGSVASDLHSIKVPEQPSATATTSVPISASKTTDNKFPSLPERDSNLPFDGISLFAEKDSDRMAYLDLIKQRYEKLFVTYYYLEHCKAAKTEDFNLLESSLEHDLKNAAAPKETGNNIIQAAQGSYGEIYVNSTCQEQDIIPIKQSFDQGLMQLRNRSEKARN